ncbi:MAG: hypothetical protein KF835_14470 [Xanthobacteraceae bacterium]|nr:hypothetical protein [Xanthobacteraceae bacterium]
MIALKSLRYFAETMGMMMAEDKPPQAAQQFFTELVTFRDRVNHDHALALAKLQLSENHRDGLRHQIGLLIRELAEVQIRLGVR